MAAPKRADLVLSGGGVKGIGLVGAVADGRSVRAEGGGDAEAPEALGLRVADALLAQGARALIDGL